MALTSTAATAIPPRWELTGLCLPDHGVAVCGLEKDVCLGLG